MTLFEYLLAKKANHITEKHGVKLSDFSGQRTCYSDNNHEYVISMNVFPDNTDGSVCYRFTPLHRDANKTLVLMTKFVNGAKVLEERLRFAWADFSLDLQLVKKFVLYAYIYK